MNRSLDVNAQAARGTMIRLVCFAALWLTVFGVRSAQRGDPLWLKKVAWMAGFAVAAVLILSQVQRLARYRIPWLAELFAIPFALGGLVYVVVAIRNWVGITE
jgi:hypothetical protein